MRLTVLGAGPAYTDRPGATGASYLVSLGDTHILLDNMGPAELIAAVGQVGGRAELEASGGITLENVREHAVPGLDFISVGALTHSAPALDLSLLLEPLP